VRLPFPCDTSHVALTTGISSYISAGANPFRIVNQIRQKLRMPAAAVQIPIGTEDNFKGVVDVVRWKAIYNEGVKGCVIKRTTIWRQHRLSMQRDSKGERRYPC